MKGHNLIFGLNNNKTIKRKMKEAVMLQRILDKICEFSIKIIFSNIVFFNKCYLGYSFLCFSLKISEKIDIPNFI